MNLEEVFWGSLYCSLDGPFEWSERTQATTVVFLRAAPSPFQEDEESQLRFLKHDSVPGPVTKVLLDLISLPCPLVNSKD